MSDNRETMSELNYQVEGDFISFFKNRLNLTLSNIENEYKVYSENFRLKNMLKNRHYTENTDTELGSNSLIGESDIAEIKEYLKRNEIYKTQMEEKFVENNKIIISKFNDLTGNVNKFYSHFVSFKEDMNTHVSNFQRKFDSINNDLKNLSIETNPAINIEICEKNNEETIDDTESNSTNDALLNFDNSVNNIEEKEEIDEEEEEQEEEEEEDNPEDDEKKSELDEESEHELELPKHSNIEATTTTDAEEEEEEVEEEQEEEEEEEEEDELVEVEYKGKTYYCDDPELNNGIIYMEVDEDFQEVGKMKNGKVKLNKKK